MLFSLLKTFHQPNIIYVYNFKIGRKTKAKDGEKWQDAQVCRLILDRKITSHRMPGHLHDQQNIFIFCLIKSW